MASGPITADITLIPGDDEPFTVAVVDGDNAALDVTGWTFDVVIKADPADDTAVLLKSTADGSVTITDAAGGLISFSISHADRASLTGPAYVYAVSRTNAGFERTLVEGSVRAHRVPKR